MSGEEYVSYLRKMGIRVGQNVKFRYPAHTLIDTNRPCLVELGDNLDINDNFVVLTHDFTSFVFRGYYKDFVNSSGRVKIGSNIVFGRNVTILKGVTIGDNCIIGAGSIVSSSIPQNSVAVGVPAKVICSLDEYYKKRKNQQLSEAFEYAIELAKQKGGIEKLEMGDFPEEWVLFLSEEEYKNNNKVRHNVDFRLKGKVDIHEFLNRSRPFDTFDAFLEAVKRNNDIHLTR
ncbi:MAG: acyltransferase [Bacteroidaceae bacterium]|nr:acyltransferase [Bacteroidaceae bacterium]